MKFDFEGYVRKTIMKDKTAAFASNVFNDYCSPKDINIVYRCGKPTVILDNNGNVVCISEYEIEYVKDNFSFEYDDGTFEARLTTPEGMYFMNNSESNNSIRYSFFDSEALENFSELFKKKYNKPVGITYVGLTDYCFVPDDYFDTPHLDEKDIIDTVREIISDPEIIKKRIDDHAVKLKKTQNQ